MVSYKRTFFKAYSILVWQKIANNFDVPILAIPMED
jgi:hypothetical protein